MEGAANIHGDIQEAAPSELGEKEHLPQQMSRP